MHSPRTRCEKLPRAHTQENVMLRAVSKKRGWWAAYARGSSALAPEKKCVYFPFFVIIIICDYYLSSNQSSSSLALLSAPLLRRRRPIVSFPLSAFVCLLFSLSLSRSLSPPKNLLAQHTNISPPISRTTVSDDRCGAERPRRLAGGGAPWRGVPRHTCARAAQIHLATHTTIRTH